MDRRKFLRNSGLSIAALPLLKIDPARPNNILPPPLEKGDKIAVIAPGGAVFDTSYIDRFVSTLKRLGYEPLIGKTCRSKHGQFAGTDVDRANEFMGYATNSGVKAIIGMRGGSGCARILPYLDYDLIRKHPKIVMGFSDITSLINAIYQKTGIITYHGPVGYSTWNDFSIQAFNKIVLEGSPHELTNQTSTTKRVIRKGSAEGVLFGGNLTVLCSMVGTGYFPMVEGGILFLEEIDEEPYAIDRMLTQLKQSGAFDNLNGIILGNFKRCEPEEPEKSFSLHATFVNNLRPLGIPVIRGGEFGHTLYKWTLPIGIKARIDSEDFSVSILERTVN